MKLFVYHKIGISVLIVCLSLLFFSCASGGKYKKADNSAQSPAKGKEKTSVFGGKPSQRITINYTAGLTGVDGDVHLNDVLYTWDHAFGLGYEMGVLYLDANAGFTYANNSYGTKDSFFLGNVDIGAGFKFYLLDRWLKGYEQELYGKEPTRLRYMYQPYWALGYRLRLPGLVSGPDPGLHPVHAIEIKQGFLGFFIGYRYEFYNEDYHTMISRWEDTAHGVHSITTGISVPIVLKYATAGGSK